MLAEIRLKHSRIVAHLSRCPLRNRLAAIENENAIGDFHHELHVVLDENDGDALVGDAPDQFVDLLGLDRVASRRRFVEQQHARLGCERARNLETLARAVGQRARGGIRDGGAQPEIVPVAPPIVAFRHPYPAGSIVIDSEGRRLYFVLPDAKAYAYQISVGREGFDWVGSEIVSRKQAWPDWHPPAEMRARDPSLPEKMTGGVNNPLGAMALYLGTTLYRIHGTNDERTLGQAASSGCFRMINGAVVHLASLTEVGTTVHVVRSLGPSAPLAGPARTAPSGVAVTAPAPRPVPPPRVRRDPWSDWDRTDTWPRRDWSGNPWR